MNLLLLTNFKQTKKARNIHLLHKWILNRERGYSRKDETFPDLNNKCSYNGPAGLYKYTNSLSSRFKNNFEDFVIGLLCVSILNWEITFIFYLWRWNGLLQIFV